MGEEINVYKYPWDKMLGTLSNYLTWVCTTPCEWDGITFFSNEEMKLKGLFAQGHTASKWQEYD